jgi:hypothetical protein
MRHTYMNLCIHVPMYHVFLKNVFMYVTGMNQSFLCQFKQIIFYLRFFQLESRTRALQRLIALHLTPGGIRTHELQMDAMFALLRRHARPNIVHFDTMGKIKLFW